MLTPEHAEEILLAEAKKARVMLAPIGVPVIIELEHPTAFMVCWSNSLDLHDVKITAHTRELTKQAQLFKPSDFLDYVRASFREEAFHALQIIDARESSELEGYGENASAYYQGIYSTIFNEIESLPHGSECLTKAAKLYYACATPVTVNELKANGQDAYISIELVRMFLQTKHGEPISEAAKGPYWDPKGYFEDPDTERGDLCRFIESAAYELPKVCPTLQKTMANLEKRIQQLPIMDSAPDWDSLCPVVDLNI